MTEQAAEPALRGVVTEYGPLLVETWLLKLWNQYGWPADHVLKRMADEQAAEAQR
jgi:hypothetical protein